MEDKTELLKAIHAVESRVVGLETKIDDSVNGRFKDNERRIHSLEVNQRWVVIAIIGAVLGSVINLIII